MDGWINLISELLADIGWMDEYNFWIIGRHWMDGWI